MIYNNSKQLRAEDALYNFGKAVARMEEAEQFAAEYEASGSDKELFAHIVLDVQVKRFEFTYDMSWKAIKRVLTYVGLDAANPRSCFKEAYAQGWIKNEAVFLEMIEMRNNTAHTYDLDFVKELLNYVPKYVVVFKELYVELLKAVEA